MPVTNAYLHVRGGLLCSSNKHVLCMYWIHLCENMATIHVLSYQYGHVDIVGGIHWGNRVVMIFIAWTTWLVIYITRYTVRCTNQCIPWAQHYLTKHTFLCFVYQPKSNNRHTTQCYNRLNELHMQSLQMPHAGALKRWALYNCTPKITLSTWLPSKTLNGLLSVSTGSD